jgi:hypothetical protein
MNRLAAFALFAAAAFTSAGSALAQEHAVQVNVPFDFTVNDKVLSAGDYIIGSDVTHPFMLVVRDQSNTIKALGMGMDKTNQPGTPGTLVFHQYGGQYFLSEIHFGLDAKTIYFPATKLERRARKHSRKESYTSVLAS